MIRSKQPLPKLEYKVRGISPEVLATLSPNQVIAALSRFSPESPLIAPPSIYDVLLAMPELEPFMNRVVRQPEMPGAPNSQP